MFAHGRHQLLHLFWQTSMWHLLRALSEVTGIIRTSTERWVTDLPSHYRYTRVVFRRTLYQIIFSFNNFKQLVKLLLTEFVGNSSCIDVRFAHAQQSGARLFVPASAGDVWEARLHRWSISRAQHNKSKRWVCAASCSQEINDKFASIFAGKRRREVW